MKWFKHYTTAMDDLFVKDIEREFGDAGYAFWFKVMELIGSQGEDGKLSISWANLQEKLRKRRSVVQQLLDFCVTSGKLSETHDDKMVNIDCPKFAHIMDNYTKYDGKSTKSLQRHLKVSTIQKEEEEDKKKNIISDFVFERLWLQYPNRQGKKEALRHFTASVKSEEDVVSIEKALANYKQSIANKRTESKYIQNGKTWFNNWRDWISPSSAMMGTPSVKNAGSSSEGVSGIAWNEAQAKVDAKRKELEGK